MTTPLTVGPVSVWIPLGDPNPGYIVGDPLVWSDDDDETFAVTRFTTGTEESWGSIPHASVAGSGVGLRSVQVTSRTEFALVNTGPDATTVFVHLYGGADEDFDFWLDFGAVQLNGSGLEVIEDLTATFDADALNFPFTMADIESALRNGELIVGVLMGSPTALGVYNGVTIYELNLMAEFTGRVLAPRRKFPRDDRRGVGMGRTYPPPTSRQYSNRRAGGYL